MSTQKTYCLLLLLLCTTVFFSCTNHEENKSGLMAKAEPVYEEANQNSLFFQKADKIEKTLLEQKISYLKGISTESEDQSKLILYFTPYDCSSCVHKGFDFLKNANLTYSLHVLPIQGGLDPKYNVQHFEYEGQVMRDTASTIHEQLGYFLTPALISYSEKKGIDKVYFIPTFEDSIKIKDFQKHITGLQSR